MSGPGLTDRYSIAADDPDHPGLAEERTDLAWNRTVLAAAVGVLGVMRLVWQRLETPTSRSAALAAVALAAVCWFAGVFIAERRQGSAAEGKGGGRTAALCRMTVGTVIFAVAALVLGVAS